MKFFTLKLDSVMPGAVWDADRFNGLALSDELAASKDIASFYRADLPQIIITKASIEVWGLSRYLVPERKAGSALLVVDFAINSCSAGDLLGPQLLRLEQGSSCRFEHSLDKIDCWGQPEREMRSKTVFHVSFSGCFLRVERNGQLMRPDQIID